MRLSSDRVENKQGTRSLDSDVGDPNDRVRRYFLYVSQHQWVNCIPVSPRVPETEGTYTNIPIYQFACIHPRPNEVGVGGLCRRPGIVWNELTRNSSGNTQPQSS